MIKRQRKLKVYRLMLVLLVLLILIGGIGHVFASAFNTNTPIINTTVVVKSGDTLWSIAEHYSTPKDDIREVIYEIQKVNHLSPNSAIIPGQRLLLPQMRSSKAFF